MNKQKYPDSEVLTPAQIDARHAHNLLERALNQVERGESDKAILACRQAVHLAPQSFPAHSLLSMLLRRSGDLDGAIVASEKALSLVPDQEGERTRLTELRAAQSNGLAAPALRLGEWDHFRQEMIREIELSSLLAAQTLATPSPSPVFEEMLAATPPEAEEIPVAVSDIATGPGVSRSAGQTQKKLFAVAGAAFLAGLIMFIVVRSISQPPVAPALGTVQTTGPVAGTANPTASTPEGGPPPHNPFDSVGTAPQSPSPAVPSTPGGASPFSSPRVSPQTAPRTASPFNRPVAPSRQPRQPQIVVTPPASVERPSEPTPRFAPEYQRPSAPDPQVAPAPRAQPPQVVTPRTSPPRAVVPNTSDDVGPRFSAPQGNDDVGPRFSAPQGNDDVGPRFSNP